VAAGHIVNGDIAVLIVDDHPVYRKGLTSALADADDVTVVGEAASGEEALRAVADLTRVDVVLMDLHMDGIGGVTATAELSRSHPDVAVLVLTMSAETEALRDALLAGARGYLVKGANQERILSAVRAVAAGEFVIGPDMARDVQRLLSAGTRPASALPDLTAREHDVLDLVARGLDNDAIARTLFLSPKTVRNYVSIVAAKLGVSNRAAAVARARDAGLGQGESR
jgi:DNA-binding NarL/FixJ family response regulator